MDPSSSCWGLEPGAGLDRSTAESTYSKVRGDFVPAEAFDEALKYRDEYRKQRPASKQ